MVPDPESEAKRRKVAAILREICLIETLTTNFVNEKEEPAGFNWDDLIDGLPKELVLQGDKKETTNMEDLKVFEWMKLADVPEGENLISTTWARKLKGALVRSRLVLRDFALGKRDDVFSPTPTPCVVRCVLFWAIVFALRVELADLVTAFMQAPSRKIMYAFPPGSKGQDGWCWRILKAMNGARTASADFSEFLAKVLTNKMCFKQGKLEPCLFAASSRMRMVIHVDDPMAVGEPEELVSMWSELNKYVLMRKSGILNSDTAVKYLARLYTLYEDENNIGIRVKHDSQYYQASADIYDLKKTSSRVTPILEVPEPDTTLLDKQRHTQFRSGVGKMQFVKSERGDIAYGLRHLAHHLHEPTVDDERNIKRMLCYMLGTAEMQQFLLVDKKDIERYRKSEFFTDTFTDANWAGEKATALSTTSAFTFVGKFLLEQSVISQESIANSTAESEYYSMGSGAKDSLFVRGVLREVGFEPRGLEMLPGRLFVDSTNAKQNSMRQGPTRKTRHLDVRYHFVQQLVKQRKLYIRKILGTCNVADIGTKILTAPSLARERLYLCLGYDADVPMMGPLYGDDRQFEQAPRAKL